MIIKYSEANKFKCPVMSAGNFSCIGPKCMMWKWNLDKKVYYSHKPYDYAPTSPVIEEDFTIAFEKGASGKMVNLGEAFGECGFVK